MKHLDIPNPNETPAPKFMANHMWLSPVIYFLVSFGTGGLYFFYFQYRLNKMMTMLRMEGEIQSLYKHYQWSMILRVLWIVGVIVFSVMNRGDIVPVLRLLLIPAMVFEVLWSIKARNILSFYIADKYKVLLDAPGFVMFFVPGVALTMMMNRIEKEIALIKALRTENNS